MRAVVTVVGRDRTGIIAMVSSILYKRNVNILDITQNVLQDLFAMVMLTDISGLTVSFSELSDELSREGEAAGLKIHTMHEDIFNSMHRV